MKQIQAIITVLLSACGTEAPAPASPAATPEPEPDSEALVEAKVGPETYLLDRRFEAPLLAAAADYSKWGYVDEAPNLAPVLCRMPSARDYGIPARARLSEAGPHGKKLYYLAARDKLGYQRFNGARSKVGQIVVKEAWTAETEPRPAPPPPANAPISSEMHPGRTTRARVGDGWLHTGTKAGLYVMMLLPPETEGTDEGWIYGTLTADGKAVTAAGRIAQCMACHESAPHGRLFGLKDGGAITEQEIIDERKKRGIGWPR